MGDSDMAIIAKRPGLIRREAQLARNVPDAFKFKSVLYVGARPARFQLLDLFINAGYHVEILEVFAPNVAALIEMNRTKRIFDRIYLGDVRFLRELNVPKADVVVWWHGPEHVLAGELADVLEEIENHAERLIVLGCPFGAVAQGVSYGNAFEIHANAIYPRDFEALGYQTNVIGKRDKGGSNILSWKRK